MSMLTTTSMVNPATATAAPMQASPPQIRYTNSSGQTTSAIVTTCLKDAHGNPINPNLFKHMTPPRQIALNSYIQNELSKIAQKHATYAQKEGITVAYDQADNTGLSGKNIHRLVTPGTRVSTNHHNAGTASSWHDLVDTIKRVYNDHSGHLADALIHPTASTPTTTSSSPPNLSQSPQQPAIVHSSTGSQGANSSSSPPSSPLSRAGSHMSGSFAPFDDQLSEDSLDKPNDQSTAQNRLDALNRHLQQHNQQEEETPRPPTQVPTPAPHPTLTPTPPTPSSTPTATPTSIRTPTPPTPSSTSTAAPTPRTLPTVAPSTAPPPTVHSVSLALNNNTQTQESQGDMTPPTAQPRKRRKKKQDPIKGNSNNAPQAATPQNRTEIQRKTADLQRQLDKLTQALNT